MSNSLAQLAPSSSIDIRGLGSLLGIAGIGYYSSKDIDTGRQYVIYVFQVESLSSSWLIYRRYSEISIIASSINSHAQIPFPPKYSLQPYALTEEQLRERFASLKEWLEQTFNSLRSLFKHGLQHSEGNIGRDMQIYYDFVCKDANIPPSYLRSVPDWAKPSQYGSINTITSLDKTNELFPSIPDKSNRFLEESFDIRNKILKLEGNLSALWECMKSSISTSKAQLMLSSTVAEELERVILGCDELDLDSNPASNSLLKEIQRVIYVHQCQKKHAILELEKAYKEKSLLPLEELCRVVFPCLKNCLWEGNSEETIDEERIKEMKTSLAKIQTLSLDVIKKSLDCITLDQASYLETCADQLLRTSLDQETSEQSNLLSNDKFIKTNQSSEIKEEEFNGIENTSQEAINSSSSQNSKEKIWCWGKSPVLNSDIPVLRPHELLVLPGINITQVACGGEHVLYLTDSSDVYCYEWKNKPSIKEFQLQSSNLPQLVQGLTLDKALEGRRVRQVSCGAQHSVAITDAGEIYTWGSGEDGRLGHGDMRDRSVPRKVMALLGKVVRRASCGGAHTVVVTEDHEVHSWGRGRNGRLGHGDSQWRDSPKMIASLEGLGVQEVACGWNFTVALTDLGRVYCWGKQGEGQCGIGFSEADQLSPCLLENLQTEKILSLACGYTHTLALSQSKNVFSWGLGEYGQLGKGSVYQPIPEVIRFSTVIVPNEEIQEIFCGAFHSVVSTSHGALIMWGLNTSGALGLGHTINQDTPQRLDCFTKDKRLQVCCGDSFTILIEKVKPNISNLPSSNRTQRSNEFNELSPEPPLLLNDINSVKSKEKEKDLRRAKRIWRTKILPQWDKARNIHLAHTMWRQGIPPTIRAIVWPLAIGNTLKITPDMFRIYKERATIHQKSINESTPLENVCQIGREFSMKLIHTDLPRTFPALRLFDENGPYSNLLLELLATYACYRPDLGYIQGMSYLAAMLCLYMPDDIYLAFQCLANLMVHQHLFTFYLLDVELAEPYYTLYDDLLKSHSRQLYNHFKQLGIKPSMYLMSWLQTLFLQVLPLEIASRVWDCFLLDGIVFLFRTALSIQDIMSPVLLKSEADECIPLLQKSRNWQNHWNNVITEERLFNTINSIHVPSGIYQQLDRLVNDVYFYAKANESNGVSTSVVRVKSETKAMYLLSDSINGLLGGL